MKFDKSYIAPLVFATLFCFYTTVSSQTPVIEYQTGEWIQTWLLCGPVQLEKPTEAISDIEHIPGFETDFLMDIGGETNPEIKPGQTITYDDQTVTWFEHSTQDSLIDLDAAVSPKEYVIAYAYCEIESPADKVCLLAIGSNDGGRAWLNGEQIWDRPEGRGLIPDDDRIPVLLKKGQNSLLIKIEERGNLWGFCSRFLKFDAGSFIQYTPLFSAIPQMSGKANLRFLQAGSVIDHIFKKVNLKVSNQEDPQSILWQTEWSKKKEEALYPENTAYGKFLLQIVAELTDGNVWSEKIPFTMGKRIAHVLFKDTKTDYRIVIGEDASESEQWAAIEIQQWLKEVSAAEFKIKSDNSEPHSKEIIIGFNKHAKMLLGEEISEPAEEDESFTYRNVGSSIIIWGGRARGTMYGVMTFLEKELGCRWYTSRVSVIPPRKQFTFDYLFHSESPGLRVRNDFYYEAFEPIWAARNKVNGAMNFREQPGGVEGYWAVHTFYRFMPPSEFFDEHPEYYSLIDGKRIHDNAQLCLTNPNVLDIVSERLQETIEENPQYLIYSVSQNDWRNPCQCDKCQAIAKKEGSEAGPLIWFVNRVAEKIEKEYPHKFVGTLAYQYTRKPPKNIRPRPNVVIRLCSIECCFAHDFNSCPENASFVSDLTGWSAIAPHMYIWDYVVNFTHYIMPYPNFQVLQNNIIMFRDNNAIGIMEQAAYQSRGGEFAELRAYVISKLLWNPECNTEHVINDFMYGYYGRSGQYIRKYFDMLHARLSSDTHIHLGLRPDDKLFSDEFVRQADMIFDQAEKVADNEEIRQRVEMARLPVMYLKCKRSPMLVKFDGTYQRFKEIVERENITHYAEAGVPHKQDFHKMVESAK
jgi:hypothetical protein